MNLTPDMEEIFAECINHTDVFCKVFLPDLFFRPWSGVHKEIFRIIDDESLQKVCIAAPRGFGKSTILSVAYPMKKILFQDKRYIVPISESNDKATEESENLKRELLENEEVARFFGNIKSKENFSKEEWVTSTGIKVKPRGAGQQIRGRRYGTHRPDLILVDDLESDENVLSEEQRKKLKNWFFSSVVNSVDRGSKSWRIIVMGTLLHENSLIADLLKDPSWYSVRLELCDESYKSNWPEFMSDEEVRGLAQEYRDKDMLDVFYREYRNIPIAVEEQGFKPSYFQNYNDTWTEEKLNTHPDCVGVVLADPAKTLSKGSANTAVVGITVNRRSGEFFIRRVVEDKLYPDQLYDTMLRVAAEINALVIAPEVTSLNEYVTYPLKTEIAKRGRYFVFIEVKPREGKTGARRSGGMVTFYRQRKVWHNKYECAKLEEYLMQWPRPSKWDVIDAVSGILFVLEEGEQYFAAEEAQGAEDDYNTLLRETEPALEGFEII